MKMTVFWDVAPFSLVEIDLCFRGAVIVKAIALMMEAESTSETSASFYETKWRSIPDHLHTLRRENLTSHYLPYAFQFIIY
jgi:hypothetical protein